MQSFGLNLRETRIRELFESSDICATEEGYLKIIGQIKCARRRWLRMARLLSASRSACLDKSVTEKAVEE